MMEKKECYNCNLNITENYPKDGIVEAGSLRNGYSVIFSFCSNECFKEFETKRKKDFHLSQIFDFVTIGEASQAICKARIKTLKEVLLFLEGRIDTSEKNVLMEWLEERLLLLEGSGSMRDTKQRREMLWKRQQKNRLLKY